MKPKLLSPRKIRGFNHVLVLNSDHHDTETHWILTDGHSVSIAQKAIGKPCTASIKVPKRVFDRLVDWYMRPQRLRRKTGQQTSNTKKGDEKPQ